VARARQDLRRGCRGDAAEAGERVIGFTLVRFSFAELSSSNDLPQARDGAFRALIFASSVGGPERNSGLAECRRKNIAETVQHGFAEGRRR
jgi:hypothetical protein